MEHKNLNNREDPETYDKIDDQLPFPATVLGWGTAAMALAILSVTFNNSYIVLGAGFFAKLFAVVVGSTLGLIGALLGDALRRFAHPTAVFTQGGFFNLVFIKLFWLAGPQLIGLFIGVFFGVALVLS